MTERLRASSRPWVHWVAILSLSIPTAGCATSRPAPPRAPSLESPGDAIPPDLDLVIRIDVGRVRSALGPTALGLIQGVGASATARGSAEEIVLRALDRADVVLVGARVDRGQGLDTVIVLEGRFGGVAPAPAGWGLPADLGGDVRRWDRPGRGPRESPARIYAFGDERLVVLSEAEIDSVEAVLEEGLPPSSLTPRSRGLLAFVARLRGVRDQLKARAPLFADTLRGATRVEGSLEPSDNGLTLDLSIEVESEESAERAAKLIISVRDLFGAGTSELSAAVRDASVTAAGKSVALRCAVPPALVLAALGKLR
jgi:hypothetical protein